MDQESREREIWKRYSQEIKNNLLGIQDDLSQVDTAEQDTEGVAAATTSVPNSAVHPKYAPRELSHRGRSASLHFDLPTTELEESIITSYDLNRDSDTYSYISNAVSTVSNPRHPIPVDLYEESVNKDDADATEQINNNHTEHHVTGAAINHVIDHMTQPDHVANHVTDVSDPTLPNDQYYPELAGQQSNGRTKRRKSKSTKNRRRSSVTLSKGEREEKPALVKSSDITVNISTGKDEGTFV